ncbi:MAG: hypothetical protein GWM98_06840 [Nitrospinaceae bacterium]|nr:hypothetical protein [Nitrospinaceae bacterium]NIR54261.1 hypothetical protein [Nitrospinaceae bacterium]NIS84678.1 hypothetical protein [Nitrospinaceae bacterium]NIT81473.1 hypothetical protein [Nitrospinaceae bacterium]NIU43757.1 hypothetical protein [Nitrospinaceae bacterium]
MIEEILNIPTPFGEPLILYKNTWGPSNGERLSIVSGLQGDRLNGLIVTSRLSRFLEDIDSGRESGCRLKGRVQIFPVVNYQAWETGHAVWPYDSQDLDLAFPGLEIGDLTETICQTIIRETTDNDYGLIVQSGEKHFEDAPHVKLMAPNRARRQLARSMGLNVGREIAGSPSLILSLVRQWDLIGLEPFILSAGKPGEYHPGYCDVLFESILNFMVTQGLLIHDRGKSARGETVFFDARSECAVFTREAGLFYRQAALGSFIEKDQTLGEVRDLYRGHTLETVTAPEEGYVVTLRDNPLVHEKELVAVLLKEKSRRWFWPFG